MEDEAAELVLAGYPSDRLRGKAECLSRIRDILEAGTEAEDLLQAVKAYATESAGFTRSKVCFSDNWFKSGRWRTYVVDMAKSRDETRVKQAEMLAGLANWVTDMHPLCRHITPGQVDALLAAELVTKAQIQAVGLRS
jgi:muconolactone delta-isomerase